MKSESIFKDGEHKGVTISEPKSFNTGGVINPYKPSGPVHPYQLDESISNFRCVWYTFSFLFYFE